MHRGHDTARYRDWQSQCNEIGRLFWPRGNAIQGQGNGRACRGRRLAGGGRGTVNVTGDDGIASIVVIPGLFVLDAVQCGVEWRVNRTVFGG